MSLRSTNVYEERSLGVFKSRAEQSEADEPQDAEVFSKYLGWHVRQQLAFDIWCARARRPVRLSCAELTPGRWLALALLLINLIEVRGSAGAGAAAC
jgi:hypothetical protein